MIKVILVAGARPNFMKIAPILREIQKYYEDITGLIVHTGQHYDENMSKYFFSSLGIREPDYHLNVGSGTHAQQTAHIMVRFEEVCFKESPSLVVVVGDVNSTIATSLVAKKLHVNLAHVEAGLRSWDRNMPEEINRIATDSITDIFFTTEKKGTENLIAEGHLPEKIFFVGNVMIDNLFYQLKNLNIDTISENIRQLKNRLPEKYICMTMHRPSNVDKREDLERILSSLNVLSKETPILFPCHPRTLKNINTFSLNHCFTPLTDKGVPLKSGFFLIEPLGYNDFLYLWKDASLVMTDSGGLQEETTALKIPCITMRNNTERPVTIEVGSNIMAGRDIDKIIELGKQALNGNWKKCNIPDLWDGSASGRILNIIKNYY